MACDWLLLVAHGPCLLAEVLGAFQAAVVALEQLLLEDDSCGLPGVQYQLVSWQVGAGGKGRDLCSCRLGARQ
jgi:hypothetical protein